MIFLTLTAQSGGAWRFWRRVGYVISASLCMVGLRAQPLFEKQARVLFQGDSITDMARGRTDDPNHILGHSYVFLIAAREGAAYPERDTIFINRGVGGNELGDMTGRWQTDTLMLKPDVLSILIGVNDVGHSFRNNKPLSLEDFEQRYDRLLAQTISASPQLKLVLCEPFYAEGKSTAGHFPEWRADIIGMQAVIARLATKYKAPVVHLQAMFDAACRRAPVEHWIWDGVHPTYSGHELIAEEWGKAYRAFYGPPKS